MGEDEDVSSREWVFPSELRTEDAGALLEFYRKRVDEFEAERRGILERQEKIEVSHAELHKLEWELKVRQEEISQLQDALSDCNVQLFEEREESLKLIAENDELKAQQTEYRRRIQHLLSMTEPETQEVTFFKDCRPYVLKSSSSSSKSTERDKFVEVTSNQRLKESKGLKTVDLPSEDAEALSQRVVSLEKQLSEQMKISKERIDALEYDRADRQSTNKLEAENYKKQIEDLEKKLEYSQKATRAATKDYLDLRQSSQKELRDTIEGIASLKNENRKLRRKLERLTDQLNRETDAIRKSIQEDTERKSRFLKTKLGDLEGRYVTLKRQKEKVNTDLEHKASEKERLYNDLKKKYQQLQQRRKLDHEGFMNDVNKMRKQIFVLERIAYGTASENLSPNRDEGDYLEHVGPKDLLEKEIETLQAKLAALKTSFSNIEPSEKQPSKKHKKKKPTKQPLRPAWQD